MSVWFYFSSSCRSKWRQHPGAGHYQPSWRTSGHCDRQGGRLNAFFCSNVRKWIQSDLQGDIFKISPLKTTPKSRRGEQSPLTNFCILVRSFMYSFNSNPFISFPKLVMFGRFVGETNLIALTEGGQLICSHLRLPVYQKYATRQSTCPMLLMTWFKVLLATRFSLLFHLCRVAQHSI